MLELEKLKQLIMEPCH